MMTLDVVSIVKDFLDDNAAIAFAYLFGSMARDAAGPLSDLDVAVYLDGHQDFFSERLQLMESLAKRLASERFDLVVLNAAPLVLKFQVVKTGRLLKDDHVRRVMFETQVVKEYLDTAYFRSVQYDYLKEALQRKERHG